MAALLLHRRFPLRNPGPPPLPKICITINVTIENATIVVTGTECKK
jgi:hypothetical protein